MSKFLAISFLLISSSKVYASSCPASSLSTKALKLLKPLIELRIKQNKDQFTENGRWIGESPHTPNVHKLFYEILENRSQDGDEAVVYLLNVYMGSHPGEELVCEVTNRGNRLLPLIYAYQQCLPKLGLEPLPKFVKGSGVLSKYAIQGINSGHQSIRLYTCSIGINW